MHYRSYKNNLLTDHKSDLHYPCLRRSNRYQRLALLESITYQNKLRSVKAYNKIAESKSKGVLIPEVYAGKNLLRFEVCFMQRLSKQFNQALLTPDTLTEESFYMGLIDRWCKEYEAIQKKRLVNMDTSKIRSPKDYLKQVIALTIQEKGLDTFLHHVDLLRAEHL